MGVLLSQEFSEDLKIMPVYSKKQKHNDSLSQHPYATNVLVQTKYHSERLSKSVMSSSLQFYRLISEQYIHEEDSISFHSMPHIIHFRSEQNQKQNWIGSQKKMRARWSEYDTLNPATPYDDARDIAWKASAKGENLYIKSREDTLSLAIRLIGIYDRSWDFSLDFRDEKIAFYALLNRACQNTSKYYRYTYSENTYTCMGIKYVSEILRKNQVERELIIIVASDLETTQYEGLSWLAKHNDIVLLHLLHPFESHPTTYDSILCESRSINSIAYEASLNKVQKEIKEYLVKNNIAYIAWISDEDPIDLLNNFFKYRYAR